MPYFASARPDGRRRRWTLAFACAALLASCDSPLAPDIQDVTRLDVTPPVLTLVVGGNATLTARVYGPGDALLPTAKVFWSTQDPSVVTITQDGVATAVASGTTQIAASAGGLSRTIAVTVSQRPIALVRITPPAGSVPVGGTLALQGEALDGTGALLPNRLLEWSSSAPEIASVNVTGVVTGVAVGQATISATGEGKTGTSLVTVLPSPVASISIQPNGGSLPAGGTMIFVATPRDASGQPLPGRSLEWRSSNDAIATISASGLLTAISPGTVTITVSAPGAGPGGSTPSASADVTVLIEPVASAVLVPATASVQVGQNVTLTVNLFNASGNPISTSGRTIAFTSSNSAVASVNSSGTVTGVTVGTVTITATITTPAQPGVVEATAQVIVSNQPVASVVVSPTPATVHVGYSRQFSAAARNAAGQTLVGRTIIWTSSNQAIATVDQSGLVVGVSTGTAQIRATSEGVQGLADVTVDLVAVASVSVAPPTATITPGQTAQLTATPRDSAGTALAGPALGGRITTWTSLGTSIATVSSAGLVTGVAPGTATIRATIGGTTGQSTITVNPLPTASQLALTTQPSSTAENDVAFPVQPVVQLRDASGNAVSTAGVVIQAAITAPGTGTLGGTLTATTNASGAATFSNLKITGLTGARTLTFTSGTLTPATSGTVNVVAGQATQLVITTQPPATANSGQVFSSAPVLQLRDVSGNAVPQSGIQVNAAVTPSAGASLDGDIATTNASGAATFSALTLTGPAGTYTLTFSSGSLASATSSAIALGAGSGSRLSLITQPSATAQNGVPFAQQPVVQLVDASNNPVQQAGVVVTVAILTGGGTLGGTTTATTNSLGRASFSGLSITGTVGPRTLLFGASGYTTVTSNAINLTAGPATTLSITTQPSATAQSGQPFASQPVIQLRDQSGNAVAQGGVAVAVSVNGAGASLIGAPSASTNSSGVATFSGLGLSGTAGTYSLSFAATGLTGVTSSSISLAAGAAAQLTITTQPAGASSGSAFTTQPVIQVRDAQGNPVSQSGITVTPSIASGAPATLLGGAATTNASGVATFTGLGLSGPVGNYTIGFSATGLAGVTSATIALGPGAPAQLVILTQPAGASSGAAFTTQPSIAVRDAQSNPVPQAGIHITASVNEAGASLVGSTGAVTNTSGVATFAGLGLSGTVGSYTLTFASPGLPNVVSGSITLTPGAAAQLAMVTQPSATVASGSTLAQQPAVRIRDAAGNNLATNGVVVNVAISAGGATLTGSTSATTVTGVATFSGLGISGTAGTYTLSFSSAGLTGTTSSAITVTAGAVSQMTITTQPAGATSGSAFATQPAIQLRDASGNAVSQSGITVTAAIATGPAGATLLGTGTATTNGAGLATFSGLGLSGTVGNYTIRFSSGSLPNVTSGSVALAPGAPAQLVIQTQPAGAVNGVALATQPVVQVRDAQGNAVGSGQSVSASLNGAGATLFGPASALTNGSGVAAFSGLGLNGTVGTYSLTFATAGAPNATSSSFTLAAGAAARLAISTPPSSTVASGSAFATAPAVQLQDAGGNPVNQGGVNISVAISPAGASLTGSTTVATNASGVATFTGLGITGTAGSYTLQFSSSGLTGVSSGSISVTPGPAASLAMVTQPPSTSISGNAFTTAPSVRLRDASGNAVSQAGASITAEVTGGGASLVGSATALTNGSGVATFTGLGITGAGTWTLTFTSTGLTSVTSSAVVVSVQPTQLGIVTQPSGTATNGQTFAQQPAIELRDAGGNPVGQSGVTVTASIATGPVGATLTGTASAVTNASGVATFSNLGIVGTAGPYTLRFQSTGLVEVTSGTITLGAGSATKLVITQQPSASTTNGAPLAVQPVVQLQDAQSNNVSTSGVPVTVALNGTGGGTLGGTATVATNGLGQAVFTGLSISGSAPGGTYTLSFSATALTGAQSGTITVASFDVEALPEDSTGHFAAAQPVRPVTRTGTKPVAVHTLGLATFNPRPDHLAGPEGAIARIRSRETISR